MMSKAMTFFTPFLRNLGDISKFHIAEKNNCFSAFLDKYETKYGKIYHCLCLKISLQYFN